MDPCIPHTLSGFTVTRRFRGATYHITVDNAAGVQHGVKSVTVDGKPLQGSVLPLAAEGAEERAGRHGLKAISNFSVAFRTKVCFNKK